MAAEGDAFVEGGYKGGLDRFSGFGDTAKNAYAADESAIFEERDATGVSGESERCEGDAAEEVGGCGTTEVVNAGDGRGREGVVG